jgi:5-bromo-4-chloroindolyl phosphate hydrolysis protein
MVLKTKSDLFLLAYILFLLCSLFLYPIWNYHFASTIIAAISISGAFISLAELFYTIQSLKNQSIVQPCELLKLSIKAMNNLLAEQKKMIENTAKEICPHWEP